VKENTGLLPSNSNNRTGVRQCLDVLVRIAYRCPHWAHFLVCRSVAEEKSCLSSKASWRLPSGLGEMQEGTSGKGEGWTQRFLDGACLQKSVFHPVITPVSGAETTAARQILQRTGLREVTCRALAVLLPLAAACCECASS